MGEKTGIEFADKTWNPWQGCQKVSPGCDNCYMYREKKQYGQDPEVVVRSKPPTFNAPLKWKEPGIVFTASWSDWFIREADPWRAEAWEIIRRTPHLFYLIFTKRPQNIPGRLPKDWGSGYPNVMLVVSTENQEEADRRIPKILEIPAAYRGVSAEPLLGPINVESWLPVSDPACCQDCEFGGEAPTFLDWCVTGGESGPGARPMHPDWVRSLRDQCVAAGVPFFFKQWGEFRERTESDPKRLMDPPVKSGGKYIFMTRVGKKHAGRLLDGRTWDEFPEGVKR